MKLKYYLRGVGTGILFATIILLISYSYKLSDGQIKKRATQLGMVMQTEEQSSNVVDNKETSSKPEKEEPSSDKEQPTEEPTGEEPTTEEPTTEEPTTEEPTTNKTENQTSSEETTTDNNTQITCVIKVTNQTGSHHVAISLKRAGIIDDANDFNNYLINNGYAYKIQNGTFTFTKGMTYEEMAKYLITGRKPN